MALKVLFLSDTHLGFDMPFRPRVHKRRRGPDFFENFHRALGPALRQEVDCVVHGGDILFRSKVPAALVEMAFNPLRKVAELGIPVFVVPGNHERSQIPYGLLASDPNIHIFDSPKSYSLQIKDSQVLFAGFPYFRKNVRKNFHSLLNATSWKKHQADLRILCVHHCFEGAQVGPVNYTFRYVDDVIRMNEIPDGFAAVLSGHIHRQQILTTDLSGKPARCPVLFCGSTERTSFAEKDEEKGYLLLEFDIEKLCETALLSSKFCILPVRPMLKVELDVSQMGPASIRQWLKKLATSIEKDAIAKISILGSIDESKLKILNSSFIRSILPATVNCTLVLKDFVVNKRHG